MAWDAEWGVGIVSHVGRELGWGGAGGKSKRSQPSILRERGALDVALT